MERDVLAAVRQELMQSIDEKTRESSKRFFKEEVKFHGVKSALVKKIAAKYFREIKDRDKRRSSPYANSSCRRTTARRPSSPSNGPTL